MATEAQKAACRRYYERTKRSHKVYAIRLNKVLDEDVVKAMEAAPNKTDYIRRLVRDDLERGRQ